MLLSSLHTVSIVVFLRCEGKLLKWNLKGFLRWSLLWKLTHDTWWGINFILTSWGHSLQEQRSAHPFCKGLCSKYFRLCKPCYSVTTVQLCCCSSKADRDKKHNVVPVKLYLQKQVVGWIWPMGCSPPISILVNRIENHNSSVGLGVNNTYTNVI